MSYEIIDPYIYIRLANNQWNLYFQHIGYIIFNYCSTEQIEFINCNHLLAISIWHSRLFHVSLHRLIFASFHSFSTLHSTLSLSFARFLFFRCVFPPLVYTSTHSTLYVIVTLQAQSAHHQLWSVYIHINNNIYQFHVLGLYFYGLLFKVLRIYRICARTQKLLGIACEEYYGQGFWSNAVDISITECPVSSKQNNFLGSIRFMFRQKFRTAHWIWGS